MKLITLSLVTLIFLSFQTVQDIGAIFWPCETNGDCTAAGSSCAVDTGLCVCENFETVFSEDFTQCLRTSLFGDTCVDTAQCNLMPSGARCRAGVCDCADGHTYVRGRCRPLNGLKQSCQTDLDCHFGYDRQSVICQDNVCSCANGYYQRYGNICRRKSMEINDACVVDTDCDELGSGVKCVSLKCQLVDEITTEIAATTTTTTAVTPTGTSTETPTDTPTETPTGSPTEVTSETPTEFTTETPTEATTGSAKESEKFISNNNKNNNNNNNYNHHRISNKKYIFIQNSESSLDTNAASPLTNGGNDLLTTDTETETEPAEQRKAPKSREIAVQTSLEAYELREFSRSVRNVGTTTASTSTSSRRTSNNTNTNTNNTNNNNNNNNYQRRPTVFRFDDEDIKTFSTLSNTDDEGENKNYGSSCSENGKACPGLAHSICSNKICFCRPGYYPNNGKCFAELGEIAESTDECEYAFDQLSKTCICQNNYFYERDLRSCRKPIQFHLSCTSNSQCSPFGAAYCNPQIPRRCTCDEYAQYDALQQMCVYKQGLGAECEANEGCPVSNSVCSNRICVCRNSFFEKDGECLAGIGADCLEDLDCPGDNAVCQTNSTSSNKESEEHDKTCQCRKGFVHFKDECLKEADEIEEVCSENEQCKPLLASCIDNKCSCTEEQHLKNGRCVTKKLIDESCSKATECFVEKDPETVECRNSVCQCKFGYQANNEHKHCIRVMPKKNSSGRPSALKIITFILIGSAFLITSAALKQAYY